MDEVIIQYLKQKYNLLIGDLSAERILQGFDSTSATGDKASIEVKGRDLVSGLPKTLAISSIEIRKALDLPH
jgi:rod shape-determining protein MreB